MLTREEVLDYIMGEQMIEKIANKLKIHPRHKEDYIQDIYLTLLEEMDKYTKLENKVAVGKFLYATMFNNKTVQFNRKYLKYEYTRNETPVEDMFAYNYNDNENY